MANKESSRSSSFGATLGCCRVESIVSVDERGQMVLPKDIRDRMNLKAGDKMAITTCEMDGKISCLCLMRTEEFAAVVKDLLGPILKEVTAP